MVMRVAVVGVGPSIMLGWGGWHYYSSIVWSSRRTLQTKGTRGGIHFTSQRVGRGRVWVEGMEECEPMLGLMLKWAKGVKDISHQEGWCHIISVAVKSEKRERGGTEEKGERGKERGRKQWPYLSLQAVGVIDRSSVSMTSCPRGQRGRPKSFERHCIVTGCGKREEGGAEWVNPCSSLLYSLCCQPQPINHSFLSLHRPKPGGNR